MRKAPAIETIILVLVLVVAFVGMYFVFSESTGRAREFKKIGETIPETVAVLATERVVLTQPEKVVETDADSINAQFVIHFPKVPGAMPVSFKTATLSDVHYGYVASVGGKEFRGEAEFNDRVKVGDQFFVNVKQANGGYVFAFWYSKPAEERKDSAPADIAPSEEEIPTLKPGTKQTMKSGDEVILRPGKYWIITPEMEEPFAVTVGRLGTNKLRVFIYYETKSFSAVLKQSDRDKRLEYGFVANLYVQDGKPSGVILSYKPT